jgi:hypothetical protein
MMSARNLPVPDYHEFISSITGGPSDAGVVSFDIEWSASQDRRQLGSAAGSFSAGVVFNTATVAWRGETAAARYVSDPAATSVSLFAEVGRESNGVFFVGRRPFV